MPCLLPGEDSFYYTLAIIMFLKIIEDYWNISGYC